MISLVKNPGKHVRCFILISGRQPPQQPSISTDDLEVVFSLTCDVNGPPVLCPVPVVCADGAFRGLGAGRGTLEKVS